MPIAVFNLIVL